MCWCELQQLRPQAGRSWPFCSCRKKEEEHSGPTRIISLVHTYSWGHSELEPPPQQKQKIQYVGLWRGIRKHSAWWSQKNYSKQEKFATVRSPAAKAAKEVKAHALAQMVKLLISNRKACRLINSWGIGNLYLYRNVSPWHLLTIVKPRQEMLESVWVIAWWDDLPAGRERRAHPPTLSWALVERESGRAVLKRPRHRPEQHQWQYMTWIRSDSVWRGGAVVVAKWLVVKTGRVQAGNSSTDRARNMSFASWRGSAEPSDDVSGKEICCCQLTYWIVGLTLSPVCTNAVLNLWLGSCWFSVMHIEPIRHSVECKPLPRPNSPQLQTNWQEWKHKLLGGGKIIHL